MKYLAAFLFIVVIGLLMRLWYLTSADPDMYHTESIDALLDADLFGGAKALEELDTLKPYLYLQRSTDRVDYLLNVLIPVPEGTSVRDFSTSISSTGTMTVRFGAYSDHSGEASAGVHHRTLIHVPAGVGDIVVVCTMNGGGGDTSTIHTDHSDSEDPSHDSSTTPYMSAATAHGLMVYTGGKNGVASFRMPSGSAPAEVSFADVPEFQPIVAPGPGFGSVEVGGRKIGGVY
jgi:hypothetical protein